MCYVDTRTSFVSMDMELMSSCDVQSLLCQHRQGLSQRPDWISEMRYVLGSGTYGAPDCELDTDNCGLLLEATRDLEQVTAFKAWRLVKHSKNDIEEVTRRSPTTRPCGSISGSAC